MILKYNQYVAVLTMWRHRYLVKTNRTIEQLYARYDSPATLFFKHNKVKFSSYIPWTRPKEVNSIFDLVNERYNSALLIFYGLFLKQAVLAILVSHEHLY